MMNLALDMEGLKHLWNRLQPGLETDLGGI